VECNGQKVCIKKGRYYTKDHMWVEVTPNKYFKAGVTDYAQRFLRELVSLVAIDRNDTTDSEIKEGEKFGTIFSRYYRVMDSRGHGCTALDLIAPVSGRIVEINNRVMDKPELINKDPYGEGWIALIETNDVRARSKGLITFEGYRRIIASRGASPFREV
jgi:glycine cleavage system H protein